MASRLFKQFLFSHVPMLTFLEGNVTIGTTGSVSSYQGSGISSVALVSTGVYDIFFEDKFYRFLGASFSFISPSAGTGSGVFETEVVSNPQTDVGAAAPKIRVQMFDASGSAKAPASASVLTFNIFLRNSSLLGKGE